MSRQVLAATLLIAALVVGSTIAVAVAADDDQANAATEVDNGPINNCSTRANVLRHLASKYSESPIGLGVAANGGVLELLTSSEGNTWTIIVTMPNGLSCMIAAGQGWQQIPNLTNSSRL